jgi:hypothetical protein
MKGPKDRASFMDLRPMQVHRPYTEMGLLLGLMLWCSFLDVLNHF